MKTKYTFILALILLMHYTGLKAQVNAYASLQSINANATELTVSNVNETYARFEQGGYVMIYHTQGAVVSRFGNNNTFGRIDQIGNTGRIEIAKVIGIEYDGQTPKLLLLEKPIEFLPDLSLNGMVQVLSYPVFNSLVTVSDIIALPWDGNVGGIVAFEVVGKLVLNHNILADGSGFRGGDVSANNGAACNTSSWRTADNSFGGKGEGIFRNNVAENTFAMGALSNGGGGGNMHNGGGGGGSNFTVGGNGGFGYDCNNNTQGRGGYSLSSYIDADAFVGYLGGGGGGGQQNNNSGTAGASGGGLILINSDTIIVNKPQIKISANGSNAADTRGTGNDGAGGGGAGGSVFVVAQSIEFNSQQAASLSMSVNGGNGGNVIHPVSHGGGGGGASGVIKTFGFDPALISEINTETLPGRAGTDDNRNARNSASNAVSANGLIVFGLSEADVLPVELLEQKVKCTATGAEIIWATASETNNNYFRIESSTDAVVWKFVADIAGELNSKQPRNYNFEDNSINHNETTYYRIRQTDIDGSYQYFDVLSVLCMLENNQLAIIGASSLQGALNVYIKTNGFAPLTATLTDMSGKVLQTLTLNSLDEGGQMLRFETAINKGVYIITLTQNNERVSKKVYLD